MMLSLTPIYNYLVLNIYNLKTGDSASNTQYKLSQKSMIAIKPQINVGLCVKINTNYSRNK